MPSKILKMTGNYFFQRFFVKWVIMNNLLNATISLLLLSLAISTRRSKLKTYKKAYQFNIPRSATQTGPGNIGKISAVAYLGDCVGCGSTPFRILSALFRMLSGLFCPLFRFNIRTL